MHLADLSRFAEEKLLEHGLYAQGWRFRFDRAKMRFGCCDYRRRLITVSRHLAALNPAEQCRDTVLHEIAHALAGRGAGHGPLWRQKCREVGARPERCYTLDEVAPAEPRYWGTCPACARKVPYYNRPRVVRACAPCCNRHSGGRYDDRFRLRFIDARSGREARWRLR